MKSSGGTYRFTLSWQMDTEEQILAGEFLEKLRNKKSRFIVQLICDYIAANPEAINPKETIKFIINSTPAGDMMTEKIRSMIQSELVGKALLRQTPDNSDDNPSEEFISEQTAPDGDEGIDGMFENLDMWNKA